MGRDLTLSLKDEYKMDLFVLHQLHCRRIWLDIFPISTYWCSSFLLLSHRILLLLPSGKCIKYSMRFFGTQCSEEPQGGQMCLKPPERCLPPTPAPTVLDHLGKFFQESKGIQSKDIMDLIFMLQSFRRTSRPHNKNRPWGMWIFITYICLGLSRGTWRGSPAAL